MSGDPIIIAGGGHIGAFLGEILEKEHPGVAAKIIEANSGRAHLIADTLERTIVINGDVIDPEILDEASVSECEAIIAVTNDDALAERLGYLQNSIGSAAKTIAANSSRA